MADLSSLLRDALQGASNSAASTVSAPVDGISWLMRKAGMGGLLGSAPVGGSDWMAQQGLTRQPQNALAGLLGESVGGVLPMVAAAKAPQIANGLLTMGQNALAPTAAANLQRGAIDVYHGSPHSFDQFDMSKIGTGEGAQAYGHGLYFAENPGVAEQYRQALSTYKTTLNGAPLTPDHPQFSAAMAIGAKGYAGALKQAEDAARSGFLTPEFAAQEIGRIKALKGADIKAVKQGQVYPTRLAWPDAAREAADPLGPQHFLQWDKPLSEQPAMVNALQQAGLFTGKKQFDSWSAHIGPGGSYVNPDDAAMRAYISAQQALGATAASEAFKNAGIPGIRYLDQGSRAAGAGSANYVVFDDKIPTITKRK